MTATSARSSNGRKRLRPARVPRRKRFANRTALHWWTGVFARETRRKRNRCARGDQGWSLRGAGRASSVSKGGTQVGYMTGPIREIPEADSAG